MVGGEAKGADPTPRPRRSTTPDWSTFDGSLRTRVFDGDRLGLAVTDHATGWGGTKTIQIRRVLPLQIVDVCGGCDEIVARRKVGHDEPAELVRPEPARATGLQGIVWEHEHRQRCRQRRPRSCTDGSNYRRRAIGHQDHAV